MPQRGDPLSISARDWTDMQRVVEKYRNGGVSFQADALQSTYRSPTIVKVLNDSAYPLEMCSIVGLGELVILPSDNEMEFIRNIAFKIETPNPAHWGVLQSPVAAGEITTAIVSGVAACKIDVLSDTDPNNFAEATASDFTKLQIRDASGIAQILWRAGGTGAQWAVIRIGNIAGVRWFVATTLASIAAGASGIVFATGLAAATQAKNEATEAIPAAAKVGVAWDDLQNCYVIAMEFC